MASQFDASAFLTATSETPNIKRPPLSIMNPAAADGFYTATIGEIKMEMGESLDKKTGQPRKWLQAIIPLEIDLPPAEKARIGWEKDTLIMVDRQFIDLTEAGTIDNAVGRNRGQRMYREAADMNKPGDSFSWARMQGRRVKLQIATEVYKNEIQDYIGGVLRP